MSQRHILNLDMFHFVPQSLVSKLILYPLLMSRNPRQNIFLEPYMKYKDFVFIF